VSSSSIPDISTRVAETEAIDRSCAVPCIAFYASAMFWLMAGTLFAMLASIKMHHPEFLADFAWLTFGRVRPAHLNTVAFGWASMAGIATLLWLMCRLCRVPLPMPQALVGAAVLWNVGVTLGTGAILAGYSEGIEWLEFPPYAAIFLFLAFAIMALWALIVFAQRRQEHVYVSQWYIFSALFWFPWLYATVQLLLILMPVKGVTQASINWWFGHNALGLWFTPIGLGIIYYLIPKVIGRPIYSYHMSLLGFWTFALFYNWAGAHHLVAGPIPAWLVTVSAVSSMMMLIPVATVAMNHHMTMRRHFAMLKYSPTLRFIVFAAMCYTAVSVQGSLMALRIYNEPTHFTHHTIGHAHLGLYGFFTMAMFGAMYYIVPRLTGREWFSSGFIRVHFWTTSIGVLLMFFALSIGGTIQGLELNQASAPWLKLVKESGIFSGTIAWVGGLKLINGAVPFIDIVKGSVPWLLARSVSGILLAVGHIAFFILMTVNVHAWSRRPATGPTLFIQEDEEYKKLVSGA